jgi:hypothetical protein
MKNPKVQIITVIGVMVAAILVIGFVQVANGEIGKNDDNSSKINDSAPKKHVETTVTAPEGAQAVETEKTDVTSSSVPNQPQKSTQTTNPAPTQESGAHIPFTQAPVVAGQPETYVGTVGQCPFYEMAGEKGCVPPSDIECNADWSVCTKKGEQ